MTTATLPFRVDPTKTGKYPINISEDLLRENSPRKRQRFSVQYNHQPTSLLSHPSRIRPVKDGQENDCTLICNNQDKTGGKYRFKGTAQPTKSFALVYDPAAKAFTLNRIDAEYRFNLTGTPSNKDATALSREFPHLDSQDPNVTHDHINGGATNDEAEDLQDETPDPDNPYDYRHFLHAHNAASPAPSPRPSVPSSPVHRPQHHRPFASSPLIQASTSPLRRPRSHTDQAAAPSSPIRRPRSRTDPKRQQRPRDRYLSPQPREEADADNEDSDPNELIIDMGDSAPPKKGAAKPWRSQLGVLNGEGGVRRGGPMSMRSAASSMSPSVKGESADDKSDADVEEIDLGDPKMEDDDGGSNGVVEEAAGLGITNGDGWDEDNTADLEAELEKAMQANDEQEQQQQQPPPQTVVDESSEESEED